MSNSYIGDTIVHTGTTTKTKVFGAPATNENTTIKFWFIRKLCGLVLYNPTGSSITVTIGLGKKWATDVAVAVFTVTAGATTLVGPQDISVMLTNSGVSELYVTLSNASAVASVSIT